MAHIPIIDKNKMGTITSIATLITLAPIIRSTAIVLKDLHRFSTKETVSLDKSKVKLIQETMAFWIIWPFVLKVTDWLPFGTILGLYTNIWLVWPLVSTPSNQKITGVRLILNDYLPHWMAIIESKQLDFVNFGLKLKEFSTVKLIVSTFGLEYLFDYLKEFKDNAESQTNSWNTANLPIPDMLLTSLLLPLFDFSSNYLNETPLTKSTKSTSEMEPTESVDGFAIVTENDFKESITTGVPTTSYLANPKKSESSSVSRKSSNSQLRKTSSSSFSSKFGFFS